MEGRGARMPESLKDAPLTADREEVFSWNYWRLRQPMPNESMEKFALRADEVREKTEKFDAAVGRMTPAFAKNLYEDVLEAQEELKRFTKTLDERFGEVAPGTTKLRSALEDCFLRVKSNFKDKGGFDEVSAEEGEAGSQAANGQPMGASSGPIRSREDAFRRLEEVATFLQVKEPQSPIYLLVRRAVDWSKMPFDRLIAELIKDSGARGQVEELLGIKPPTE
jgi:type VI secretion system protein ImpA